MNDHDVDDGEDFDGIEDYDQTAPIDWDGDDYDNYPDPEADEYYDNDDAYDDDY